MTVFAFRAEFDHREEFDPDGAATTRFAAPPDLPEVVALLAWHDRQLLAEAMAETDGASPGAVI